MNNTYQITYIGSIRIEVFAKIMRRKILFNIHSTIIPN